MGIYSEMNSIFFISNWRANNIKSIDFVISIIFSYDYEYPIVKSYDAIQSISLFCTFTYNLIDYDLRSMQGSDYYYSFIF